MTFVRSASASCATAAQKGVQQFHNVFILRLLKKYSFLKKGYLLKDEAQNALQHEWGNFPLKWDLLRISVTACTIDKNKFSAPFGIFYVKTDICKEIFPKMSYTTP